MNSLIQQTFLCDELKNVPDDDNLLIAKMWCVYEHEKLIDPAKKIYMFTWAPDPKEFPDCDFQIQHDSCVQTVADFLKSVPCGLACVESSTNGHPHYHGWYQKPSDFPHTQMMIAYIKTMQKTGNLKTTSSRGHYKIGSWSNHANCLHYYKKELLDEMLGIYINPIHRESVPDYKISDFSHFFCIKGTRQTVADIERTATLQQFYKDFYTKSID